MNSTLLFGVLSPFAPAASAAPANEPTWQETLEQISPAVVSIRVTATRDFDTDGASVSQGTGFVVDRERGLILTNRHMVQPGPVIAEAVFLNDEEVPLIPVYRDPVHDFGFYQFDPSVLRFQEVVQLPLVPTAARVGEEIRVVGNDAGEKLSILDGTLARLDREAPDYGSEGYNDFNTFYFQAASNTSGGSSGSPVVNRQGQVVALNAGGRTLAASSFYLPLDRVVRALDLLRADQVIARGTLQTVFRLMAWDELRRLGLGPEDETNLRKQVTGGLLVAQEVLPGGPGAMAGLQPGDILVAIQGRPVGTFVALEEVLDASVDRPVSLEVVRGASRHSLEPVVQDLHAITPSEYLEFSRAIFQPLSYQIARNTGREVKGVMLTVGGYALANAGVQSPSLIMHLDGTAIEDLDGLEAALASKADGQRVLVGWQALDSRSTRESVVTLDRTWFPARRCVRDDTTGLWPCRDLPLPVEPAPPRALEPTPTPSLGRKLDRAATSQVMVEVEVPYSTAGVKELSFIGTGTVVDAARGLVLCDRDTVPVTLSDVTLTFGASTRVPGVVRFLHPTHNLAVVQYDPAAVAGLEVTALPLADRPVRAGEKLWQIGLNGDFEPVGTRTRAQPLEFLELGASRTPRFRDANVEGFNLTDAVESYGGALVDRRGHLKALWASFIDQAQEERAFYGLGLDYLRPVLAPLLAGEEVVVKAVGFDVAPIGLLEARDRGVPTDWVLRLIREAPDQRRVFEVQRRHGGSPADDLLRDGDLVLAVNGRPLTQVSQLERAQNQGPVDLTLVRSGQVQEVTLEPVEVDGRGQARVLSWAGMLLHETHYDVRAQQGLDPFGVYVAWLWYGSPAARYEVRPTRRIIKVDDEPVGSLDEFWEAVRGRPDRSAFRLTVEAMDGTVQVQTLVQDLFYWPTERLELQERGWVKQLLEGGPSSAPPAPPVGPG